MKEITEAAARDLIRTGQAGYWEASLRDSISKSPIAHAERTCVFLDGKWYLIPVPDFKVEALGRHALFANMTGAVHMVSCEDDTLTALLEAEMKRMGKPVTV